MPNPYRSNEGRITSGEPKKPKVPIFGKAKRPKDANPSVVRSLGRPKPVVSVETEKPKFGETKGVDVDRIQGYADKLTDE